MSYSNQTGLASVTQCFSPYVDWSHINQEVLRKASERGSRVHAAIADEINGEFPMLEDGDRGYFDAAMKFMEIVDEIVLVEKRLTSDVHQYTGQIDLVCRIKGDSRFTLLDWKTSSVISKSWPLQISGYKHLVSCNNYQSDIGRCMAVQLKPNGTYKINEYLNTARDFSIFLNCLTAFRYFKPKTVDIDWDAL